MPEKEEVQGKYAFLQKHPLYKTHHESLNVNLRLVPLTEVSMSNSDA